MTRTDSQMTCIRMDLEQFTFWFPPEQDVFVEYYIPTIFKHVMLFLVKNPEQIHRPSRLVIRGLVHKLFDMVHEQHDYEMEALDAYSYNPTVVEAWSFLTTLNGSSLERFKERIVDFILAFFRTTPSAIRALEHSIGSDNCFTFREKNGYRFCFYYTRKDNDNEA